MLCGRYLEWLLEVEGAPPDLPCPNGRCTSCRLERAEQTAAAIMLARPRYSSVIALADPVEDWSELAGLGEFVADAMPKVQESLAEQYENPCPICARVELNKNNQGHIHILSWGARLRAKTLRFAARHAGLSEIARVVEVAAPRSMACYFMKTALWPYVTPFVEEVSKFDERLNPGLLVYENPKFWRDASGSALGNLAAARTAGEPLIQDVLRWASKYRFMEKMPPLLLDALSAGASRSNRREA
jgi:hypothetical protein